MVRSLSSVFVPISPETPVSPQFMLKVALRAVSEFKAYLITILPCKDTKNVAKHPNMYSNNGYLGSLSSFHTLLLACLQARQSTIKHISFRDAISYKKKLLAIQNGGCLRLLKWKKS
ncbi:hypothetical protein, partial [Escherichia coli]|uniref:hypothetical protein n=1 Tax=Escherichia coli TaxID=562 RepID=UPI0032DA2003